MKCSRPDSSPWMASERSRHHVRFRAFSTEAALGFRPSSSGTQAFYIHGLERLRPANLEGGTHKAMANITIPQIFASDQHPVPFAER